MSPARARSLGEAGFRTVRDLLFHIPSRYEDRRQAWPVADAADTVAGGSFTFQGRLSGLRRIYTRRRGMSLVRGVLEDGTGKLPVVWFNLGRDRARLSACGKYGTGRHEADPE